MNRNKLFLMLICLFLVHTSVATSLDIRTYPIRLNQKVSPIETDQALLFSKEFNVLTFALGLYQLDINGRLPKEAIKEKLVEDFYRLERDLDVSFDLERIDLRKRGFTRYYPFRISDKDFIIRIFDIKEKHFLPKCEVLYEGVFDNLEVGFQIIPGIKALLSDHKIEKAELPPLRSPTIYP